MADWRHATLRRLAGIRRPVAPTLRRDRSTSLVVIYQLQLISSQSCILFRAFRRSSRRVIQPIEMQWFLRALDGHGAKVLKHQRGADHQVSDSAGDKHFVLTCLVTHACCKMNGNAVKLPVGIAADLSAVDPSPKRNPERPDRSGD